MIALGLRESHHFTAAGRDFLYLVPSAAIFALDDVTSAVLRLRRRRSPGPRKASRRAVRSLRRESVDTASPNCSSVRAIGYEHQPRTTRRSRCLPMMPFPLTTMVLNVTNQCNLACTYCYEYGEDKIVDTENGRQAEVHERGDGARQRRVPAAREPANRVAHLTFFGGETLLNFPVLQNRRSHMRGGARRRRARTIDFSLTTNATLLRPEIIEFLAENHVGVTVSIDGPQRDAGQVPRLPQRQRQLRYRRAEDQGTARAAPHAADRRARHADVATRWT